MNWIEWQEQRDEADRDQLDKPLELQSEVAIIYRNATMMQMTRQQALDGLAEMMGVVPRKENRTKGDLS